MKHCLQSGIFFILISLSACFSLYGLTGADEGRRMNEEWVVYKVIHPGQEIKILEPYSPELMPIETIGKKSPAPLRHLETFGTSANPHKLEIVGKYSKKVYHDETFYGILWTGEIIIKDGVVFIDGKKVMN